MSKDMELFENWWWTVKSRGTYSTKAFEEDAFLAALKIGREEKQKIEDVKTDSIINQEKEIEEWQAKVKKLIDTLSDYYPEGDVVFGFIEGAFGKVKE